MNAQWLHLYSLVHLLAVGLIAWALVITTPSTPLSSIREQPTQTSSVGGSHGNG